MRVGNSVAVSKTLHASYHSESRGREWRREGEVMLTPCLRLSIFSYLLFFGREGGREREGREKERGGK